MNVLFVVSDDLTSTALGCYGHPLVQSPHIDSLARSGTRFDRAYCQFALCAPSRASFLTGLRPDFTGVLSNGPDFRDRLPHHVTLPQLFKNNGYQSIREGKLFHMGVPTTVGTDRWQDAVSWTHNGSPQGKEHNSKGEGRNLTPHIGQGVAMHWIRTPDASEQADFDAANRAIAHLEKHRNEPFFLGLGFVRPHVPFVAPGEYFDKYPLSKIKTFRNPDDDLADIPPIVPKTLGVTAHHMGMNQDQQMEALRGYYASITFMDDQLGRVLKALDRLQLRDRTVIVFLSDHGWHLGEHTFWQKRSLMEESAKVPLIISAPGQKARGQVCRSLVELVDLYPTVAELCGLKPPEGLHGKSLVPLLDNPQREHKATAHTQLNAGTTVGRAVRTKNFRYIRWRTPEATAEELYDHRKDPKEFTNVAASPAYQAELERHRRLTPA
ncbi:MAG: sulfatase [Bryobacteraceae bacterium]|nr:sulfatase [Bryobacteraceae bacterium]MDW8377718.1 sulfatase [Bryobacterales bacterium]